MPVKQSRACASAGARAGRESEAAHQSTMSGTGMTQEMESLAFEGSQGVELTDEEAEESAERP